ncbi:MAG: flagellar M-ring protein FliF [Dehalococcoidia bacterium]|nr:flagellar M-ring protein FliF [Dehalococcoidia bacterium]NUQ56381.1 flagellar M-ring protein FliF [Dehalococcoidia bacterium]
MGKGSALAPILDRWNQLPQSRQIALGALVAGAVVVLYLVFVSSRSPNLVVAYSGLAPEDSAAIADQLEKDGVPYEIGGGGATVSVPANKVAEVRIKLAQAGLPSGGSVGFEIFDNQGFGTTDFVEKVNYRRGLEGELARSINTLDGVKGSRVHIVLPKDALFKEDQKATTASVLLQLKPGADLTQDQVHGIANLVSNSVEGLDRAGITIVDETGHVLFDGATMDSPFASGATATQMELQRQYELALQRDVESTLAKVVGYGRSAVTIRARLNFDTVTHEEDTFGEGVQVRSSSSTTETYTGSNLTVGNIPGTGANDGTDNTGTGGSGNSQYSRTETTTNNEIPRTTTSTIKAPGSLEKLSVSVVLDDSVTAAQETSITSAVAAAVGLDQTRGDIISVTRLPFDVSVKEGMVPAAGDGLAQYLQYLKLLLPLLAVILGFILVMLLLRSLSKRQLALPAPQPAMALAAPAPVAALHTAPAAPLPALEAPNDPREERVLKLAEANPRAVADVVQTWMREEDR